MKGEKTHPVQNSNRASPFTIILLALSIPAAITWAANASSVFEVIFFIQKLFDNWRDFFRGFWSLVFEFININIYIEDYQKDAFTLVSFTLFAGVLRGLAGFHPAPVFKNFGFKRALRCWRVGKKYSSFILILKCAAIVYFSIFLYIAFIAPFVDTSKFDHDFKFIWASFVYACVILTFIVSSYRIVVIIINYYRDNSISELLSSIFSILISTLFVFLVFGIILLIIFLIHKTYQFIVSSMGLGVINFFEGLKNHPLNPLSYYKESSNEFMYLQYLKEFSITNIIDLFVLLIIPISIGFFSGRSLAPVISIVTIGISIVFIGVSADQIWNLYNENLSIAID